MIYAHSGWLKAKLHMQSGRHPSQKALKFEDQSDMLVHERRFDGGGVLGVTTILLVDEYDVVRQGLRALLGGPGWDVVGEASDGLPAIEMAEKIKPDIVIVDYLLPTMTGADVARRIKQLHPSTEVMIFTVLDTEDVVRDSLSAGALGFLVKSDDARQFTAAIESLIRHQPYFTATVNETLLRTYLQPEKHINEIRVLTGRERQVVTLIAEGKSCREAAKVLGISAKTAETHRASARRKLRVTSSAALIRYAVRNKWVPA